MKVLLSKEELHDGVTRMADEIAACYKDQHLTIIGVLTGSVVLMADLIRMIDVPMRVGVLQASSYRGATTTRGELVINSELMLDIRGRDVLLGRRHLRHRPYAQARDGQDAAISGRRRCGRRCCCGRRRGRKSSTIPISWRSTFRTSSSSATASTTKTCIAICRIWRRSKTSDIARHKQMTVENQLTVGRRLSGAAQGSMT